MKKLMFAATIAALCGAVHAADAISSDVVGYSSTGLTQGKDKLTMVGGAFNAVGADGFQMNGNITVDGVKGGTDALTSDTFLKWDPTLAGGAGGYATYYYYDDGEEAGWCDSSDSYVEDVLPGGFPAGTAFWFKAYDGAEKNITFSGAVKSANAFEPALAGGTQISMISDAYPVALQLNNTAMVEFVGLKGGTDALSSDTLLLWDPTLAGGAGGYATYYYYDDGEEAGWCDSSDSYVEDALPGGFPVGTAFWFKPYGAGERTIRFKKNF